MSKYPKQVPITLQQRLRKAIHSSVAITAEGLALEPGILMKVFKSTFIIVQNERFVPRSTNYIHILGLPKASTYKRAGVRTVFDAGGLFDDIGVVKIGKDFIEVQPNNDTSGRYLIPLNKVVGLFAI